MLHYREAVKALAPMMVVGAVGLAILPSGGNPSFFELAWYQQVVSASWPVAVVWSFYRAWTCEVDKPTPEERVGVEFEDSGE